MVRVKEASILLSAEWIDELLIRVVDKTEALLDRILFAGIIRTGLMPLEESVSKDVLKRMTEEQFQSYYSTLTPEEQDAVTVLMAELEQAELDSEE